MIYEFHEYLLEQKINKGTHELNKDEFNHMLKTYCSDFKCSDMPIYRCTNILNNPKYLYVDANDAPHHYIYRKRKLRKSYYISNNTYTIFINHLPSWKKFPKRQIICSTGKIKHFGQCYRVIPFNNSNWGVVPADDIQSKQIYLNKKLSRIITNAEYLMSDIKILFDLDQIYIDDYTDLKDKLKKYDLSLKELSKLFSPYDMKFVSKNYKQLIKYNFPFASNNYHYTQKPLSEIWTDSDVLLIRDDIRY